MNGKNKETVSLKNLEDVPLAFAFDKDSIKGDVEQLDTLIVSPVSGIIKPLGD